MERVAIVGGGIGGLATAIRLQHAGSVVTLIEKNERLGGRCNRLELGGFTFDTGPTLLLMRDVLDDLFRTVGRRLEDYLELIRVDPNYRVHFGDGSSLLMSSDLVALGNEMERFEPGAAAGLRAYLDDASYKYRVSRARFVERNFVHWHQFFTLQNLYYLLTTNTLRKLDQHAGRYFSDSRLLSALTFQTMYLGLAPHDAPAVYALLPWTELDEGIWFPRGGMYAVVEALARLARELGVTIRTGVTATGLAISGRHAHTVEVDHGPDIEADRIVCNADLPYAFESLVPVANRGLIARHRSLDPGSSAFLMYLGVDGTFPGLHHHNVYLSSDTEENFGAIFEEGRLPTDPSFYTCLPSRTDPSLAPPGQEALYVLVPVPPLGPGVDWGSERERFTDLMYRQLESRGYHNLRARVVAERIYTPQDFVTDYNLMAGSAFGISHSFTQVGYMRPQNKAGGLDNLYFVGASTVPGGGVPMVILGSRLTAERIELDRA